MTRKERRRIFFVLFFAFIVSGGGITLYAQGWRVIPGSFSIQKVGAIYVRSFPENASIFLDGKQVKARSSWFFGNGTLINNLLPGEHELVLTAPDYLDWHRTFDVKPSIVSEVKFAVLLPSKSRSVQKMDNVEKFWRAFNVFFYFRQNVGIISQAMILRGADLIGVTDGGEDALVFDDASKTYLLYNIDSGKVLNVSSAIRSAGINSSVKIILDSFGKNRFVLLGKREVRIFELGSGAGRVLSSTTTTSISFAQDVAVSRQFIAWTEYDSKTDVSRLALYDRASKTRSYYSPLMPGKNIRLKFTDANRLAAVQNNGDFYFGAPSELRQMANDVKEFALSEDGNEMAVLENSALEIFPLRNSNTEKYARHVLPEQNKITKIAWYKDARHLFVGYLDKVMFLDVDDLGLENFLEAAPSGEFEYELDQNRLHFLKDGTVFGLDFPE